MVTKSSDFPPEALPIETEDNNRILMMEKSLGNRSFTDRVLVDDGSNSKLDVLGLWTSYAECRRSNLTRGCNQTAQTASNMLDLFDLAIKETNDAYGLSGINAELVLVHAELVPYTEAPSNASEVALGQLTSPSDGILDDVHNLRSQYGADIVAMIIDDDEYCGASNIGPYKSGMFSIVAWSCATGYYSFGNGK